MAEESKLVEGRTAVEAELAVDGIPRYRIERQAPGALVIHCGDPRFQTAFRRFINEELGIRTYTPIIIGGGIHSFGVQTFLPKNYKVLWEQIKFFVKEQNLHRVIIINHEDCQWYEKMKGYPAKVKLPLRGKFDLQQAAKTLLSDFAGVEVNSYWAALDGDQISFSEVS